MEYLIEITDTDIANGKQKSYTRCPVALAIKRRMECEHVGVAVYNIYDCIGGKIYYVYNNKELNNHAIISKSLSKEIIEYDNTGKMKPCIIILDTIKKRLYKESILHYIWRRLTDVLRP